MTIMTEIDLTAFGQFPTNESLECMRQIVKS